MLRDLIGASLAEIKLVRSPRDLRLLCGKIPFLTDRASTRSLQSRSQPLTLQLEPTNCCNIRCICCSRANSRRTLGYIDFPLFQRIIDAAAESRIGRVHLYLHGEPFLHPRILDMLAYIKARRLAVNLVTNGTLLTKDTISGLLRCGLTIADYIVVSVLGSSKEVHERVMKGVNHDRIVTNVSALLEARRGTGQNGPIVHTIFYTLPENYAEASHYLQYWKPLVDHACLIRGFSQSFATPDCPRQTLPDRSKTCPNLWQRLTIYWTGEATLCCADIHGAYILGNLSSQSIQEVWTCETLARIKALHRAKRFQEIPLCAKCDMGSWDY